MVKSCDSTPLLFEHQKFRQSMAYLKTKIKRSDKNNHLSVTQNFSRDFYFTQNALSDFLFSMTGPVGGYI